jgi:hypothetical protein
MAPPGTRRHTLALPRQSRPEISVTAVAGDPGVRTGRDRGVTARQAISATAREAARTAGGTALREPQADRGYLQIGALEQKRPVADPVVLSDIYCLKTPMNRDAGDR